MVVLGHKLMMTRGDAEHIAVILDNATFAEGDVVEMTVRKRPSSENVLFHKRVVAAAGNEVAIDIEPEDTAGAVPGPYYYDVQLTHGGDVHTIIRPGRQPNFELGEECTYD